MIETHTHMHEHGCVTTEEQGCEQECEQECEHESHWWNKVVIYAATAPLAIPVVHFVWHFIANAFGLPCP